MPEVSLVAILDADKEGFLRSDRSLIQTIGRAARNIEGKAILYADKVTGSMQRAIDETDRRREKQIEHNIENNIAPRSIVKKVADIMESAYPVPGRGPNKKNNNTSSDPKELFKQADEIEKRMLEHARNLEFEDAAKLRDELESIRNTAMGIND